MLLADLVLVAYLYHRNAAGPKRISGVNWVFAIWFMIAGSRPLGAWLSLQAASEIVTGAEGSPINTVSGIVFAAIGFYIINKRRLNTVQIIRLNVPLFVLLGYCLLSSFWSAYPLLSLRRSIRMILEVVVVVAILSEPDRLTATKRLVERYAIFALPLSLVMIKYYPRMAIAWNKMGNAVMWTGVAMHKNSLGAMLAVSLLYYAWKWLVGKNSKTLVSDIFLFLLAAYMLFNPQAKGSSTAILSLIVAVVVLFVLGQCVSRIDSIRSAFYVGLLAAVLAMGLFGKGILEYVTHVSGREMTFTGRTYIWDAVLREAAASPIVGTGYGTFWVGSRLDRLHANPAVSDIFQAHNGYIETYANLGLIGLALLVAVYIVGLDRGLRGLAHNREHNSLVVAYLVLFLLAEFFEASTLSPSSPTWILLLLLTMRVPSDTTNADLPVKSLVLSATAGSGEGRVG